MNLLAKICASCATLVAVFAMYSCDAIFHDELADCPQGVYVRFYQQTPCHLKHSSVGQVNNLVVLAFDKHTGLLANYVATDHAINLSDNHETYIPLTQGDYDLVAWAGNADNFQTAKLQKGVTQKSDVFFQLRQQQDNSLVFPNTPEPLRFGFAGTGLSRLPLDSTEYAHFLATSQYPLDEVINIPDPAKYGSVYRHAAINFRQQALRTNVHLIIDGDKTQADGTSMLKDFQLNLLTSGQKLSHEPVTNGVNTADWDVPQAKLQKSSDLFLLQPLQRDVVGDTLKLSYNLLGNTTAQLADGRLTLQYKNENVELSDAVKEHTSALSLPALIRIALQQQNANLSCGDEVTIKLRVKKKCKDCNTFMVYDVEIEKWNVHSYETELHIQ